MTYELPPPFPATLFDGELGVARPVEVTTDGHRLRIESASDKIDLRWIYEELRAPGDQADRSLLTLHKSGGGMARLLISDETAVAHLRQRCKNLRKYEAPAGQWRQVGIWAGVASAAVALILFVLVPLLADQMAALIPPEKERALGDSTLEQIRWALAEEGQDSVTVCRSEDGLAALRKMEMRLSAHVDQPHNFNVVVFDHEMVNAFALPGGHIVLFRGLLEDADSAEEVAGVLGHEMGHVINRDPTRLALRSAGSVGLLGLLMGDFAGGAAILLLSEKVIQAAYSKDAEAGADDFAHNLLAKAGLPSSRMADFFHRLMEEHGEDEGLLSHLASHPDLNGRADAAISADTVDGTNYRSVLLPSEWRELRQICGAKQQSRLPAEP